MAPRAALVGVVLSIVVSYGASASAQVVGVPGTVVEVSAADVAIQVFSETLPAIGDTVEIGFQSSSGQHVSIGFWKVVDVGDRLVWVKAVCSSETPAVGMDALVFRGSPGAVSRPQTTTEVSPPVLRSMDHRDCSEAILANIEALASTDSTEKRKAAKTLYRHFRNKEGVAEAAEFWLRAEYNLNPRDGRHVDAMAWLCNILGATRQPVYKDVLSEVAKNATNSKVRAFAAKNLRRLG